VKKWIVVVLALVAVLGLASTALAAKAAADVPVRHWAYGALAQLARDGLINADCKFAYNGTQPITRKEMAAIVANAMGRIENANAEDLVLINKLSAEFSQELKSIGVKIAALEHKTDKLRMAGVLIITQDYNDVKNNNLGKADKFTQDGNKFEGVHKLCLDTFYKVNDNWTVLNQMEYTRDWRETSRGLQFPPTFYNSISGKIGDTILTAGRFRYNFTDGLLFGDQITGAQVAFGSTPNIHLTFATIDLGENNLATSLYTVNCPRFMSSDITYPLNASTNFKVGYHRVFQSDNSVPGRNYLECGIDKTFANRIVLTAVHGKSTYETDNDAWAVGLGTKLANFMQRGSQQGWITFFKVESLAAICSVYDAAKNDAPHHGVKGYEIGWSNVLTEKAVATIRFIDYRATNSGDLWTNKWWRFGMIIFL